MTKEEAKKTLQDMWECLFNEMTTHTFEDLKEHGMLDNYSTAFDMAISALKGLDLPDNATNEDAFNYMLRQTFPKTIFIHFHNETNLTEGVVMAKEWLSEPYKKGE